MTEKLLTENFDRNFAEIKENIEKAAKKAWKNPNDIILLAATKTVDIELINYAIDSGIEYIGENRVQEFLSKKDGYAPCHRHFIGHLQTNKVKDIVPFVELIHSVDSVHLAKEISKVSLKLNKVTDILLEVNIGDEESKSGFKTEELEENLREIAKFEGIRVRGLMAIPPICETPQQNIKYFSKMQKLFIDIAGKKIDNSSMDFLSMGMSGDYACAIENGANIVRIGTALFGKRDYTKK
ncbi:MAG: YggS family pyridoxal phosphate-dependent enzyme [Clostridia bacterium]|nr:YggS family pyridoxal phosphate-dependent enzyme [Clostridia bacterium]